MIDTKNVNLECILRGDTGFFFLVKAIQYLQMIKLIRKTLCIAGMIVFLISGSIQAQVKTQTLRGIVVDKSTKEALIGVHVYLAGSTTKLMTTTDLSGAFELSDLTLGRIRISCDYLGYRSTTTPSFILNSAKEPFLEIEMEQSTIEIDEVIVYGKVQDDRTQNEMIYLSGRSFSAEETERYAGSIADPSRMAVGFAGVQASNDINNDIVIRGNSSVGVLWRLEGIDIPNPNHFSRRASSGGGISVFSVNMLRNSDFIYGAPPPEYGNALAGIFDMKFRKGNKENREYSFRAGLLGLDAVAEGPIKKGQSSYLVNFRYSTLGILNKMGVHIVDPNTDNSFTDLAFHLYMPSEDNRHIIQWWGIAGYSSEFHHPLPNLEEAEEFDDFVQTDFKTSMAATGMTYTKLIDNRRYFKSKLALTTDEIIHNKDTINTAGDLTYLSDENYRSTKITAAFEYSDKISSNLQLKTGGSISFQGYDLKYGEWDPWTKEKTDYLNHEFTLGSQQLVQAFIQSKWDISSRFSLNAGLSSMFLSLNNSYSINPQLSGKFQITNRSSLSFATGKYSQAVPIGSYYSQPENIELELMQSIQANLAYSLNLKRQYKISLELYYQYLSNIPIASDEELHYWMLNDLVGFSKQTLSSDGLGKNYGMELSLEKYFNEGFFLLSSLALYKSEYSLGDDDYFSSKYDGTFNTSLMMGKEVMFKSGSMLQVSFRNIYYGGLRYSPPNAQISESIQDFYLDYTSPLTRQNKAYLRSDLRLSFRKNKKASSWILALDVQNLLNINNTKGEFWNLKSNRFEYESQAGIIPVLSFQLDY